MPAAPSLDQLQERLAAEQEATGNFAPSLSAPTAAAFLADWLGKLPETAALPAAERALIAQRLHQRMFGLGPLQPLLNDPAITEVMVNGPQQVLAERDGRLVATEVKFESDAEVRNLINRLVAAVGRRLDEAQPLVDARLPDGSRINAVIAPLSRVGTVLTIRRFPPEPWTLPRLMARGLAPAAAGEFLRRAVVARLNILVSGSTGSGKTALLNALAGAIPVAERLVTIEDTAEIMLGHPHWIPLEARPPNMEGAGEVSIRTLLKNALRMRPDRIIIGEVRGGEALDLLQAMNTGHQGSLTTIHANGPAEALLRLETMALLGDVVLPLAAVRAQVKAAVQLVVQLARCPGGARRLVAIAELLPGAAEPEHSPYQLQFLWQYHAAHDRWQGGGRRSYYAEQFNAAGVPVEDIVNS
ncbi:MAG: CpaF family protein [Candidatus Magasanikbacteria bacterium]|nr:CpaF family protein [Candidatus Magasanikbacteria bacterium]